MIIESSYHPGGHNCGNAKCEDYQKDCGGKVGNPWIYKSSTSKGTFDAMMMIVELSICWALDPWAVVASENSMLARSGNNSCKYFWEQ